ncbi:Fc.00g087090.m01.CDS01 [Cosmosporella sp. VM-42]
MALLNPVYAFLVPFLFIVTVPLAIVAGITTTVAFSVLILRVLAVYLDVALSLLPGYLTVSKPQYLQYASRSGSTSSSPTLAPLRRRRRRRSSSALSAGTLTPVSDGALGIMPSIGPERDFEGVGGWRVGEDEIWTTINSRLELPDKQHGRNHHRTPSGPTTPGEGGYLMMKGRTSATPESKRSSTSPNSSRTRTPSGPRISFIGKTHVDGYFPMLKTSPKKRLSPNGLVDA